MKKLSFILAMLLLPAISTIIESCCPSNERYCRTFTEMNIQLRDNSGLKDEAITNGQVLARAMMLQIDVTDNVDLCNNQNPFKNAAFAFDCRHEIILTDSTVDFSIRSNHDFTSEYKAGVNLLPLFSPIDIRDMHIKWNKKLYLLHEPADTGTHIFTVSLLLSNGKRYDYMLDPVKLLK